MGRCGGTGTHQVVRGEGLCNVVDVVGSVCLTRTGQHHLCVRQCQSHELTYSTGCAES